MKHVFLSLGLLVALPFCLLADTTGLGVVTTNGWVSFSVCNDWKVSKMQTKSPTTLFVFRIPNPADEKTPDATSLVVMTFETGSPDATASYKQLVDSLRAQAKRSKYKNWNFYTRDVKQGDTIYTFLDGVRKVPGAYVVVRLAWPHLKQNPPNYGDEARKDLNDVLDSVDGGLGKLPDNGAEVYRPPA